MGKSYYWVALVLALTGCGAPVVAVAPGFTPVMLQGRAGGRVASGLCGYIGRRPNHRLQVSADLDYAKLRVTSPAVVTLWVKGPDGVFCATPIQTRPAQISGYWKAGTYDLFIGSPAPNTLPNYQLLLTTER
ncbi:hypothetical protein GlitD10_0039 [Gloeomargarita lithophora Alchichica-D10]|uniref:Lipoprotein n=1 Tax=Gloeomargarita lithophora Alchichica-D10 TaxID=1188229 RepID=A0A1J0A8S9_9CYAN|nr:hypothetical protein [Gloeomargarita lithophora]APB32340.1 hypothetical protein GlitD10_0039 [Gloeomargarita lithophora Alchichica-D10]